MFLDQNIMNCQLVFYCRVAKLENDVNLEEKTIHLYSPARPAQLRGSGSCAIAARAVDSRVRENAMLERSRATPRALPAKPREVEGGLQPRYIVQRGGDCVECLAKR